MTAKNGRTVIVSDWAAPVLITLAFIGFAVGVNLLVLRFCGWYDLSVAYPRPLYARPPERWWLTGKIERLRLNAGLIVGVDAAGLYLGFPPPMKFIARPLYIPWTALQVVSRARFLWMPAIRLRTETGTPIELYGAAARMVDSNIT